MKKLLLYATLVAFVLFACSVDSIFESIFPIIFLAAFVVLGIVSAIFIKPSDFDEIMKTKEIDKH